MKIALSIATANIDKEIDPRFGRSQYLAVIDQDNNTWETYPNPARNASGGAGIKAAEFLSQLGVDVVISGEFGPNAYQALRAAGMKLYRYGNCQKVEEALARFDADELEEAHNSSHSNHGRA